MFPAIIDNTMRKALAKCPTKFQRAYVDNLRGPEEGVHKVFGHAFAKGIEVTRKLYYFGNSTEDDAIQAGIDAAVLDYGDCQTTTNKTLGRLPGALRFYWDNWPLGEDGLTPVANGIEVQFAIPLPIRHPDTGEWLQYAGRFDLLSTNISGRYFIVDEKTTVRLGDTWPMQWDMDSQLTGYIWAAKQPEFPRLNGIIVPSGAEIIGTIRAVSILTNGYGKAEVPVGRTDYMLEMWYAQMLRDVERMVASYRSGIWDKSLGNACVDFGHPCEYTALCKSPNPERLLGQYQTVVWNPLEHKQ